MSNELTLETMRAEGLLPDQARFFLDLFADGSPPHHQLCAHPGTGKSFIAAFLIDRITATASDNRVLVLGPEPLVEQFLYRLRERSPSVQAAFVNRRQYRELVASVAIGESPWKDAHIVGMSDDFAKQKDIATSLAAVKWDWVLVDESHRLVGARRAMIERLLNADKIARLLLLSTTPVAFESPSPLATMATTSWSDSLRDWDDKPLKAERKVQVVEYQRSPEEIAAMTRLNALLEMLVDTPMANLQKAAVHRAAQSSLSSLEQIISTARNQLAHGQAPHGLPYGLDTDEGDPAVATDATTASVWQDSGAAITGMAELLEAIDELKGDTKLDALAGLLDALDGDGGRGPICIVSAFETTVTYILAALGDRDGHLYGMTGSDHLGERRHAIECCVKKHGILVTSIAAMHGFELSEFRVVALYDLPHDPRGIEQVIGKFNRHGPDTPRLFCIFHDTSEVLKLEDAVDLKLELSEQFRLAGDAGS